jgi:hypothetical protein
MIGISPGVALLLIVLMIGIPITLVVLLIRDWPSSPTGDPQRPESTKIGRQDE